MHLWLIYDMNLSMKQGLSIIMPVFKEQDSILYQIDHLLNLKIPLPFEIIISDGDPDTTTINHIQKQTNYAPEIILVASEKGRGLQMNTGALRASNELLFFLHADTRIDRQHIDQMIQAFQDHGNPFFCGTFDLKIHSGRAIYRIIEKAASIRSRITRLPYGDQGIFMSKELFSETKGFPEIPIMEDVGMMSQIKRKGVRPVILNHKIMTSPRRWEKEGIIFTTLRNWVLILMYTVGASPHYLARFYKSD
jgi:rSAM/selenodomain-associated transferase 2